ncbi:DUF4097 family beta strand repeat-containing protein [Clavibacter michiganensis]|uniref:DUF4097 family beta strand repeat-containing protein n=1 Tax=Clavibacter michiganensis TaxID=28447 RepID=UPI0011B0EC34|nr:DUF4097 family beta strand repeat-containing protein [Clavibacter michiganensis]
MTTTAPPEAASGPTPPRPNRTLRVALISTGSAALVLVAGIAISQAVSAADRVDGSQDSAVADPFDRLGVEAGDADVTVRYGDVGQAHVDFTAGDTGLTETHAVDDGQLVIKLSGPAWRPFDLSLGSTEGATIDVLLPEADQGFPALEVQSTTGDINVSGFFGDTILNGTEGDILITGAAADLTLGTAGGAIDARNIYVAGELQATSTAGDARLVLDDAPSAMTVETAGDQLIRIPAGAYDIRTSAPMGEATNTLGSDPDSTYPYRFSSTAGDIIITQRR